MGLCGKYIHDLGVTLTFGLNIKSYLHSEFVSEQGRLCSLIFAYQIGTWLYHHETTHYINIDIGI